MNQTINIKETAKYLGITTATVLNWEKHGYLRSQKKQNSLHFSFPEIKILRDKIEVGEIDRLTSRANKKNSTKNFAPEEYMSDDSDRAILETIFDIVAKNKLKTEESIFALTLNLLVKEKLLEKIPLTELLKFYRKNTLNDNFKQELNKWQLGLKIESSPDKYQPLLDVELPNGNDPLGMIYQMIQSEGNKSKSGSYYTPAEVCDEMAGEYLNRIKGNAKILDPCCGTGQFLIAAGRKIRKMGRLLKPVNLWGYDIDPVAIHIARINLMLLFRDFDFNPNIYQRNLIYNYALDDKLNRFRKFDLILGNPPWGAEFRTEQLSFLKEKFPQILTMESFSYFLFIGLKLLRPGGFLSFILPESVLNTKYHKDIRNFILIYSKILKIDYYGRMFKNVFTPVIRIDIEMTTEVNKKMPVLVNETTYEINTLRFFKNMDQIFDIFNSNTDHEIIEKVYSVNHTTLAKQADWVLGIVTGNNQDFLSTIKKKNYLEILKGTDIEKFRIKTPKSFILFDPERLQQAAPLVKYKSKEKLVYKFISSKLIFALDTKQTLTLNSANIVIPKVPDYPIKVILALFNSSLYQFMFSKKFFTHKVLRSHLEQLPLPLWDQEKMNIISEFADKLTLASVDEQLFNLRFQEFDNLLMNFFSLNELEKSIINKSIKQNNNSLLTEQILQ